MEEELELSLEVEMYLLVCSLTDDAVGAPVAVDVLVVLPAWASASSSSAGSARVTGMMRLGPSKTGLMSPSMTATPPIGAQSGISLFATFDALVAKASRVFPLGGLRVCKHEIFIPATKSLLFG